MNKKRLDWLLRDWGNHFAEYMKDNGYPSSCVFCRITTTEFTGGPLINDSWPYPELADVNIAMHELPEKYSLPIAYQRVERMTYSEVGKQIGLTKDGARTRIEKAESELINLL